MLTAIRPTDEEDAAITAAALSDPDNPPLAEGEGDQLKTARRPRGRPAQDATKVATTMRLDNDVLDSFKATGDGWQTRINAALREHLSERGMLAHRFHVTMQGGGNETKHVEEFLIVAADYEQAREKLLRRMNDGMLPRKQPEKINFVDVGNARLTDVEVIY